MTHNPKKRKWANAMITSFSIGLTAGSYQFGNPVMMGMGLVGFSSVGLKLLKVIN